MESGKDIDIKGSKAGGKKVEVKTGNNLSMSGSILTQIYVEEKKREWEKNEKDSMKVTEKIEYRE